MNLEQITELRKQSYNATVVWLNKVNPDLMRIRIQPDFPLPPHHPGQYSSLGLGYWEPRIAGSQVETIKPGEETKLVRRAYSIGHPILDDHGQLFDAGRVAWLEFYIVLVRESTDKAKPPGLT